MLDFYGYLWRRTWPWATLFLLLWIFVLARLFWKARITWRHERDIWGFLVLMFKGGIWAGVLAAYSFLFFQAEGDWFAKPLVIRGTLESKDISNQRYVLTIQPSAEAVQTVFVNETVFLALQEGDELKLTVLPIRREAAACEVLKRP